MLQFFTNFQAQSGCVCIIHNCVLYLANYGNIQKYMSDKKKTNLPTDRPTFENVGQSTSINFFFLMMA